LKITVTHETCVAAQQCSLSAPAVFGESDDGFVRLLNANPTDPADQDGARHAEKLCPSGTIQVDED
jgi:ferredoxin